MARNRKKNLTKSQGDSMSHMSCIVKGIQEEVKRITEINYGISQISLCLDHCGGCH